MQTPNNSATTTTTTTTTIKILNEETIYKKREELIYSSVKFYIRDPRTIAHNIESQLTNIAYGSDCISKQDKENYVKLISSRSFPLIVHHRDYTPERLDLLVDAIRGNNVQINDTEINKYKRQLTGILLRPNLIYKKHTFALSIDCLLLEDVDMDHDDYNPDYGILDHKITLLTNLQSKNDQRSNNKRKFDDMDRYTNLGSTNSIGMAKTNSEMIAFGAGFFRSNKGFITFTMRQITTILYTRGMKIFNRLSGLCRTGDIKLEICLNNKKFLFHKDKDNNNSNASRMCLLCAVADIKHKNLMSKSCLNHPSIKLVYESENPDRGFKTLYPNSKVNYTLLPRECYTCICHSSLMNTLNDYPPKNHNDISIIKNANLMKDILQSCNVVRQGVFIDLRTEKNKLNLSDMFVLHPSHNNVTDTIDNTIIPITKDITVVNERNTGSFKAKVVDKIRDKNISM